MRIFGLFHVSCIEATKGDVGLASEVPYLTEAREILEGSTMLTVDEQETVVSEKSRKAVSFLS